jgi:hypothetical protein
MRFDRPIVFRNPTDQPIRYAVIISHAAMTRREGDRADG